MPRRRPHTQAAPVPGAPGESVLLVASADGSLSRIRLRLPDEARFAHAHLRRALRLRHVALTWRAVCRTQVLDDDGSGACRPWATPGRGGVACVDVAEGTRVVAAATAGGTLAALDLAQPGGQVRPA